MEPPCTSLLQEGEPHVSPSSFIPDSNTDFEVIDPPLAHLLKAAARSSAVRQQFSLIPPENYTQHHDVKLFAGTFNVNGRRPGRDDPENNNTLDEWLSAGRHADIVAVGFQEIVPLNATNVVLGGAAVTEASHYWDSAVAATLNAHNLILENNSNNNSSIGTFIKIAGAQLVGIYLTVFVRSDRAHAIRGVQIAAVGTGVLGMLGNKGAVGVRLRVYDSSLAIINAHLSSGDNEGDDLRRHADYSEALRRGAYVTLHGSSSLPPPMALGHDDDDDSASTIPTAEVSDSSTRLSLLPKRDGHWGDENGLLDVEHALWMGDLNYRLVKRSTEIGGIGQLTPAIVAAAIRAGHVHALLERDQLRSAMRDGIVFNGWSEADIAFPPTFKYKRTTDFYVGEEEEEEEEEELLEEEKGPAIASAPQQAAGSLKSEVEKIRMPAWTDRILYKSASHMTQLTYKASQKPMFSDHRPVSAAFLVRARHYVPDQVEAAVEVARKIVDAHENSACPCCALEPKHIDLGVLGYAEEKILTLTIKTLTPGVVAFWKLIGLPGETATHPAWLQIQPASGELYGQGDDGGPSSTEIRLRACVTGGPLGAAQEVSIDEKGTLDAILIIRVANGNDMFLSVTGTYQPSCFGLSPQFTPDTRPFTKAIDYLLNNKNIETLAQPGLFVSSVDEARAAAEMCHGSQIIEEIHAIRKILDEGGDIPEDTASATAVASVLMALYAALPMPLLPKGAIEVCDVAVPLTPVTAAALAREGAEEADLEVIDRSLELFKAALQPEMSSKSGLTSATLAVLLAELWFPPIPGDNLGGDMMASSKFPCAPRATSEKSLQELQAMADGVAVLSMRRIQFIEQLLQSAM